MKCKIKLKTIGLLVSFVFLFPLISSAELLIEESFKTGDDPDAGEYAELVAVAGKYEIADQENTVTGFTDAWRTVQGGSPRVFSGLKYIQDGLSMAVSGGSIVARANPSRAYRELAVPFDADTTGIYYLGFLFKQHSATPNPIGYRSPFQLYSASTMLAEDLVIALSMDPTTAGQVNVEVLGTTTSLGQFNTSVYFAVFRFDMSTADASDSIALYINPPLDERLELQTPVYTTNNVNIAFNTLGIHRNVPTGGADPQNVYLDEIRMSRNYFDVSTVDPSGMTKITIR